MTSAYAEVAALAGCWSAVLRADAPELGWLALESTDLRPAGSPYDPRAWLEARGHARGAATFPLALAPRLSRGFAAVRATAARTDGPPIASIELVTYGAEIDAAIAASIDRAGARVRARTSFGELELRRDGGARR